MARSSAHIRSARTDLQISLNWRRLFSLAAFLAVVYILVPQFSRFQNSARLIRHLNLTWLVVAIAALSMTYVFAAALYCVLAKHALRFKRTLLVALASNFANRLLPAGSGAIGVNYLYLRRHKHTAGEAGAVVAANNTIGLIGHGILLGIVLGFISSATTQLHTPHVTSRGWWLTGVLVLVGLVALLWLQQFRRQLYRTTVATLRQLAGYRTHPLRLLTALGCSLLLTSSYVACLAACAHAMHLQLGLAQLFLVLTVGITSATLIPIPGGLGSAEAGLLAGFVAFRIPVAQALAVVLVYRLLTYWIALLLGAVAFELVELRGYL